MIIWGLILLITSSVWAQRPEGLPQGHPWAMRAQEAIDNERFDEALVSLRVDLKTPSDFVWHHYLTGLVLIGQNKLDSAEVTLKHAAEKSKEIESKPEAGRLLARVERKLGLIERKRGNYDLSRQKHYEALDLAQSFGSAEEEHGCLISLDVDCYYLGEWEGSERTLRQSLEVAGQITDPVARTRAQATSNNNLAGTLAELQNFTEAQEKAQAALTFWEEWQTMTGNTKDFRAGWAHYALADMYLKWAASLAESNALEASNKRGMAKYELMIMTVLAREAQRPQSEFDLIDKRLKECE